MTCAHRTDLSRAQQLSRRDTQRAACPFPRGTPRRAAEAGPLRKGLGDSRSEGRQRPCSEHAQSRERPVQNRLPTRACAQAPAASVLGVRWTAGQAGGEGREEPELCGGHRNGAGSR